MIEGRVARRSERGSGSENGHHEKGGGEVGRRRIEKCERKKASAYSRLLLLASSPVSEV